MPREGVESTANNWTYVGSSTESNIQIPSRGKHDSYEISVVPRSANGARRSAKYGTNKIIHVRGKTDQPDGVINAQAVALPDGHYITWDNCSDIEKDVNYYEIREGAWWGGRVVSTTNGNAIKIPYFSLDPVDYYIKSRDTSDNWSDEPVVLTGESPATGVYSSVANKLYAADFTANGSLNDLVDTAGVLRTDTGVSNGTGVYTGDSLDIGEIGDYLVMVSAETLITPQDPTLDRMGVYLDSPYAKRRLLSELVADSMEGSENRQMYDLDGHNYALDSLYANFDNVKKPKEMDDLPCVTVEFRTSSDDATWSAWHDSPSRVVEGIRYVQPRVTMLTDYTELSVEMSKLTVEVTNIPGAGGDSYEKGFTDTTTKTFTHNLGGKPTIQVLDASGVQTEVCVTYVDDNTSKLDFIGTLTDHTFIATMGGAAASSQANSFTVNSTSVDYTLVTTDRVLIVDASSSNITVTLPAAASSPGFTYNIKKSDATSNTVIVDGNGSETIDGGTTAVITTQYETIQVVCDGTCWFIL